MVTNSQLRHYLRVTNNTQQIKQRVDCIMIGPCFNMPLLVQLLCQNTRKHNENILGMSPKRFRYYLNIVPKTFSGIEIVPKMFW